MSRSSKFSKSQKFHYHSNYIILQNHTDSLITLNIKINEIITKLYQLGVHYYKAGIVLFDLINPIQQNLNLFQSNEPTKQDKISSLIYEINQRFGKNSLVLASTLSKKEWKMRRQNLLPKYTTAWEDILLTIK